MTHGVATVPTSTDRMRLGYTGDRFTVDPIATVWQGVFYCTVI